MDSVDAVVIGAGVVGLATARALALAGCETLVLEHAAVIGSGTSSRNSEVIHAGLYYPTGSLKARLCVAGREQLYAFCASHGVEHRRCGKLLVAVGEAERAALVRLRAQAEGNGVGDLRPIDTAELATLEPALSVAAALLSPSTGIVDGHGLMLALQGDLEAHGGAVVFRAPVRRIERADSGVHRLTIGGAAPGELGARIVVNAAGLWAPTVAATISGLPTSMVPHPRYVKGNYFGLAGRAPFTHLIYPLPEAAGLGVHLTLDLAGRARFGPDVEEIAPTSPDAIDYRVDPARAAAFETAVRRWWPGLPPGGLAPAYSGVRPKLLAGFAIGTEFEGDFVIQGPERHGQGGLVNLYGIESPGLTACLAIADEVLRRVGNGGVQPTAA